MKRKLTYGLGAAAFFVLPLFTAGGLALMLLIGGSQPASACSPSGGTDLGAAAQAPANTPLFQAIKIVSAGNSRQALAMLMGSYLESGWNNHAIGAGSYGPYQIQDPGMSPGPNPSITAASAMDPTASTNYMAPRYRKALNYVNPQLWLSNPEQAGEETAVAAEGPLVTYYAGQGAVKVHAAYTSSSKVLTQLGIDLVSLSADQPKLNVPTSNASAVPSEVGCDPYTSVGSGSAAVALDAARAYLGYPYVFGGGDLNGPTGSSLAHGNFSDIGFDCSGLTRYAFHKAGVTLPRTSEEQWTTSVAEGRAFTDASKAQPGDLVFFGSGNAPHHVGIVVDPQKGIMINAPKTGDVVRYSNYTAWADLLGFAHYLNNDATSAASPTSS